MRKVIAGVMVSLDGVMQAPGGPRIRRVISTSSAAYSRTRDVLGPAADKSFGAPFDLL